MNLSVGCAGTPVDRNGVKFTILLIYRQPINDRSRLVFLTGSRSRSDDGKVPPFLILRAYNTYPIPILQTFFLHRPFSKKKFRIFQSFWT